MKNIEAFESIMDIGEEFAPDMNALDNADTQENQIRLTGDVLSDEPDNLIKYCIAASVILHLVIFVGVTRIQELTPTQAFLKPGEKVSQVRLIEQEYQDPKSEVPPENTMAYSDRDHTALRERITKRPPGQTPSLGTIEPVQKRMAALIPPQTPEDLSLPDQEKKIRDDSVKAPRDERQSLQSKPKPKNPTELVHRQRKAPHPRLDLKPTQEEQDIAAGLASPGGAADFFPEGDVEEAVVDINTREEKFFSYLLHLKRKIQGVWVYPSAAANLGIGGQLTVEFSISREGELIYATLLDSSGHSVLDESALKAIRSASPYFPFPPRMRAKRLKIRANFIYLTGNYFRRIM